MEPRLPSPKKTDELCGAHFEEHDPRSPRCMVSKRLHQGVPHRTLMRDGRQVEWPST